MKKLLTLLVAFLITGFMYGQGSITGKVIDNTGDPLIGASVYVDGTTTGTITDGNGAFMLKNISNGLVKLVVSYIGFETTNFDANVNGKTNVGTITLKPGGVSLDAIVVTGVMDIVQDRRTPVAVSTIPTSEIQAKAGNVEFPELLKSTPSIYVANQSGGYGDSEVFTRGFDQTNTAFLLNGQPINGMEDGKMYWSNWSGMTDVATAVQVQRGLGSSKLAISSVGGTTNIIMRPTAQKAGGTASFLYGNDNYMKATVSYNTGMINDKFGVTVLVSHWQGDGWADGTKGQGQSYFFSAGYKPNANNEFNFLITGAPQWHDQNYSKKISDYYNEGEFNIKYNNNYGFLDGEYLTLRRNYYHKPVANLNWDMTINETTKLSTVLYGSWGRGGGTGGIGRGYEKTEDGHMDWDKIVANNIANGGATTLGIRGSVNNHSWYGAVTNFEKKLNDNMTLSIGADLRTYKGDHFREMVNLLGADYYDQRATARYTDGRHVSKTYKADPWSAVTNFAGQEDQVYYSNSERISYGGVFGQFEYTNDKISTYVQGAVSNQSHIRYEIMNELADNEESDKVNNLGYNAKGGLSYSINDNNTVFFNSGYYSRQPFHDNIYLNYSNKVNPVTENENIFGIEAGYKFANEDFAANFNVYRTAWNNRTTTRTINEGDTIEGIAFPNGGFINLTNLNQLHQGVELDFKYSVNRDFNVRGFASVGDWTYSGIAVNDIYDDARELKKSFDALDVDGIKVGGAAQTSLGLGADYKISGLRISTNYNYYDNLYSKIGASASSLKLPAYGLLDFGLSYNLKLNNDQLITLRANIYNALGTEYISQANSAVEASENADDNWNGVNKQNRVRFGKTRTWNVSAKYSF